MTDPEKKSSLPLLGALAFAMLAAACGKVAHDAVANESKPPDDDAVAKDAGAAKDSGPAAPYVPDPGSQSANFQIDSAHTGGSDDPSLVGTVARRWEKDFAGDVAFPLIAHGKVMATSITADKHGALQAFDALTGASVWGPIDLGPSDIASSVYDGGRVFALTRSGRLQAFDVDTGARYWAIDLADPLAKAASEQFLSAPTAHAGRVYVLPNNFGFAVAVDEMTGLLAWSALRPGSLQSPAVTDTGAFFVLGCRDVYRLDPKNGAVTWHHEPDGCATGTFTPIVTDSSVFVPSEIGTAQLDEATGAETSPGTMIVSTFQPVIHGGIGVFPLNDRIHALALPWTTGSMAWDYRPDGGADFVMASMIAGGHVHTLWRDCTLRAFDAQTGVLAWSDAEPAGCEGNAFSSGVPISIVAAAGTIAVPFGRHLVVYGVTP